MDKTALHAAFKAALTNQLRGMTPEQQADFMSCMLTALLAALPDFIASMMSCMAGSTAPPAGGFDPGNRSRCD
jgi:hypothetical protein